MSGKRALWITILAAFVAWAGGAELIGVIVNAETENPDYRVVFAALSGVFWGLFVFYGSVALYARLRDES